MITSRSQRWRDRRDLYRPAGELFNPSRFGVEPIYSDNEAANFVEKNHYSGSFPLAVHRFGLYYRRSSFLGIELVGVAVFGIGSNEHVIPCYAPGLHPREGLELNRFVLRDECADGRLIAGNAETWFLGRAFQQLRSEERRIRREDETRKPLRVVIAAADPIPRRDLDGVLTMPGHIGWSYVSFSGRHVGKTRKRKKLLTADGRTIDERAICKVLAEGDRIKGKGHRYVYQQLLAAGWPTRRFGEDPEAYMERAIAEGVKAGSIREVWHPGNLVYGWPMSNAGRDALKPPLPYPTLAEYGLPVEP
jgi:hypothetical protein